VVEDETSKTKAVCGHNRQVTDMTIHPHVKLVHFTMHVVYWFHWGIISLQHTMRCHRHNFLKHTDIGVCSANIIAHLTHFRMQLWNRLCTSFILRNRLLLLWINHVAVWQCLYPDTLYDISIEFLHSYQYNIQSPFMLC